MKLPFDVNLSGRTAVVTGGTGVLGSVFSRALSSCGANVAVLGRHEESARALMDESDGRTAFFKADVLDAQELRRAREGILARFGKPSILINGAGGNNPKATTEDEFYLQGSAVRDFFGLDPGALRQVFDLNYFGTLQATQVFAGDMAGIPGACIVNVSSMNAYRPLTKVPAYSGAKAAVQNLTMWMATYFAKAGLRVNAIAPGFFIGNQNRGLLFSPDGKPTPRTEKILRSTPMERFGEPEELAGTLLYLVSPEASGFVTGIVIPVDGGFSAYSGV